MAAILSLAAACAGDGEERRAEPPPAPPRLLVTRACAADLEARNERMNGVFAQLESKHRVARALRDRLENARRRVRAAEGDVEAAEAEVRVRGERLRAATAALAAFEEEHPERELPRDEYERWQELRAEYEAAQESYEEAYARYRGRFREYRARVRGHDEAVRAHNANARGLEKLARKRVQLARTYDRALAACLARAASAAEAEKDRLAELERRLAAAASRIAGREASVDCEPGGSWRRGRRVLGFVPAGSTDVHLAPSVCYALHRLVFVDRDAGLSCLRRSRAEKLPLCPPEAELVARAVSTVAHEAQHVAGVDDEAEAQCFGLQAAAQVARDLGITARRAQLLAWYTWRFPHTPPDYQSAECRPRGALDRRPDSPSWP